MTFLHKIAVGVVLAISMAILGVVFYQQHGAEYDVESAKFDEGFSHHMGATSKDPAEKAYYKAKEDEAIKEVGDSKKRLAMRTKEADKEAKDQLRKLKAAQGRMEKDAGISGNDDDFDKTFESSKGEVK